MVLHLPWDFESPYPEWKSWNWQSEKDYFLNGAYFVQSGKANAWSATPKNPIPRKFAIRPQPGTKVRRLTKDAGTLGCKPGKSCWEKLVRVCSCVMVTNKKKKTKRIVCVVDGVCNKLCIMQYIIRKNIGFIFCWMRKNWRKKKAHSFYFSQSSYLPQRTHYSKYQYIIITPINPIPSFYPNPGSFSSMLSDSWLLAWWYIGTIWISSHLVAVSYRFLLNPLSLKFLRL